MSKYTVHAVINKESVRTFENLALLYWGRVIIDLSITAMSMNIIISIPIWCLWFIWDMFGKSFICTGIASEIILKDMGIFDLEPHP